MRMDLREIPFWACNGGNYKKGRSEAVRYIVMHYTANNGDTAKANCQYYGGTAVQASAHYFVDEREVWQSVRDSDTAWHCGAKSYRHPECRNANSIGVEMCSDKINGQYVITAETAGRAVELVRALAARYGIDRAHIIRHYDVTGKSCPEPWVRDEGLYIGFLDQVFAGEEPMDINKLTDGQVLELANRMQALLGTEPPGAWSQEARRWAEGHGVIQGSQNGGLQYRAFVTREELAQVAYRLHSPNTAAF